MKFKKQEMDLSLFQKIVTQMKLLRYVNIVGVGEPFLNPDFLAMLEFVKTRKLAPAVSFSTNATLLDQDIIETLVRLQIDKIGISIDGLQGTFETIRKGARLSSIVQNVDYFKQVKDELKSEKPRLEANFVLMKDNIWELPEYIRFCVHLGFQRVYLLHPFVLSSGLFDRHLHSMHQTETNIVRNMLESVKREAEKSNVDLRMRPLEPTPALCREPWYQLVVNELGQVKPCCFLGSLYSPFSEHYFDSSIDVDPEDFTLSNGNESLLQTWKNEAFRDLRKDLLRIRREDNGCNSREAYLSLRKQSKNAPYCKVCQYRFQTAC
jgi:MoaA/NifB/PqqE/SkfB family radical SAM enzyme